MIYWITAADKNGRVIYNVESEFKGLGEALDSLFYKKGLKSGKL